MQDRKSKLMRFREKLYEGVMGNREAHRRIGRPKCKVNYIGGGNTWRPCEKWEVYVLIFFNELDEKIGVLT